MARFAPRSLANFHGTFDRRLGARQHDLPAAIIVGGGADADARQPPPRSL